jgi:putative spermidine/putrescine transport system substrate-binding protein
MAENRKFIESLLSLALRSPHAADYGRRQFLHSVGRLALGVGVVTGLGRLFGNPYALAAETVTLPEITSIPERLKGKGVVRVSSYG